MQRRGKFSVSVTKDYLVFASAHFITFAGHRCEGLHGHNYRASVTLEGELDEETWFVFDFVMLKQIMRRLCDEIDHKVLLPLENPRLQVVEDGESVTVAYEGKPRYLFPRVDCALLPIPEHDCGDARGAARQSPARRAGVDGRAWSDGHRDGSRGELRAVGRLPRRAAVTSKTTRRRHLGRAQPAVVERGGDERAVTPGIGESHEVFQPANSAAGHERQPRRGLAHARDQRKVEPGAGADARQVEHDHRAGAGAWRRAPPRCAPARQA